MERTRNVLLDVLYSNERLARLLLPGYLFCPEEERSISENDLVVQTS